MKLSKICHANLTHYQAYRKHLMFAMLCCRSAETDDFYLPNGHAVFFLLEKLRDFSCRILADNVMFLEYLWKCSLEKEVV